MYFTILENFKTAVGGLPHTHNPSATVFTSAFRIVLHIICFSMSTSLRDWSLHDEIAILCKYQEHDAKRRINF